jgi:hypothetical protein
MLTAIEVGKELMKSKVMAKFSHYRKGELFYYVELNDGVYQFPIPTMDVHIEIETLDTGEDVENKIYEPSSDLGDTFFNANIKGSELIRWIRKAIDKDEFIFMRK